MRVRAGETPEEIADSFGAGLDWVMRFAGPVMDERERVADEARRARARRSTTDGPERSSFGEAVDARFAAHGIDPSTVRWDARRREDGEWIVTAHWVGGEAEHGAEWMFHLGAPHRRPDRRHGGRPAQRPADPAGRAGRRPSRRSARRAPPLVPGVVAFPPMPDAHTGPLPRVEEVFDQEVPADDDPRAAAPRSPPTRCSSTSRRCRWASRDGRRQAAAAGPKLTNLGMRRARDESDDERAARARVPSWDDILLGVRRKQD